MFIFLSFPPPFLSAFHCSAADPSRCFRPANTHLGCPPILFGNRSRGHPGLCRRRLVTPLNLLGWSGERFWVPAAAFIVCILTYVWLGGMHRSVCTRRPLSLPRPRPASPVPTDPSCCRISQERAITPRRDNTTQHISGQPQVSGLHPHPPADADVMISVTPTSKSCIRAHLLVMGYSRHASYVF